MGFFHLHYSCLRRGLQDLGKPSRHVGGDQRDEHGARSPLQLHLLLADDGWSYVPMASLVYVGFFLCRIYIYNSKEGKDLLIERWRLE